MLFLCPIVSLDGKAASRLWRANHLSVCTLRSVQIHLLACCWASPLNPTKSTQSECFFFVLSCPWTAKSPRAYGARTTFRSARCAFANTFARLLLSESTHKAKSTQSECFFFVLSCPWTIASSTAFNMRFGGRQAPPSRP